DKPGPVDQKHVMWRRRGGRCSRGRLRLRNQRFDNVVHGFLHSGVALFRCPRRCRRRGGLPPPPRTTDEETRAIRTLDLPGRAKIEIALGMTERSAVAIAGGDRLIDVDGFERPHLRPGKCSPDLKASGWWLKHPMIRITAAQSMLAWVLIASLLSSG